MEERNRTDKINQLFDLNRRHVQHSRGVAQCQHFGTNTIEYILHCTQHIMKVCSNRISLFKLEIEESKALDEFKKVATPTQWRLHLLLEPKLKLWSTKNENFQKATKRVEYNLLPKFIGQTQLSFNFNETQFPKQEAQEIYDDMKQISKDYHTRSMTLVIKTQKRGLELLTNEIKQIIQCFPNNNDDNGFDTQAGLTAFHQYNDLREKRFKLLAEKACHFLEIEKFLTPTIINQANIRLTEDEQEILQLGPRFIYNDPKTATRRRTIELVTLKRKIEARFHEKKVSPGRPVNEFINELYLLLQNLHNIPVISNQYNNKKKKNYHRLLKRLKFKFKSTNTIIRKTDKSKVFHLDTTEDYDKKSIEYMNKTKAYQCLDEREKLRMA
ncbi:hypothetical protein I4U23_010809, partial [Adineta vaga]